MASALSAQLGHAFSVFAGSRVLAAILATFTIAFGAHLLYGPAYLPHVGGFSLATIGLPTNLDFGVAGQQAREAAEAAARQGAGSFFGGLLDENRGAVPILNGIGFLVSLSALVGNLWVMTKRRAYTRG